MLVLNFSKIFLLTASLMSQRMSVNISLFTEAIPVNYTSEFREIIEVVTYYFCRQVWFVVVTIKIKRLQ